MLRTSITPEETEIHLSVPQNYVGRKLEVLLYPIDELTENIKEDPHKKKPSDFAGTMSKKESEEIHKYLKNTRNEWEEIFDRYKYAD